MALLLKGISRTYKQPRGGKSRGGIIDKTPDKTPDKTLDKTPSTTPPSKQGVEALKPFTLGVKSGEFLVIMGPSGCGKSTLLKVISGLDTPTTGTIIFDGKDITTLPPHKRGVAMVFQDHGLYPHMTVEQNIAFGLHLAESSTGSNSILQRGVVGLLVRGGKRVVQYVTPKGLRGNDLRGNDQRGNDLRGSNLRGNDLRGSNLRGSNLRGSNLRGSNAHSNGEHRNLRAKRVLGMAHTVGVAHLMSRYPKELSGGERQRVALARALVHEPKIALFDEPLSNLDMGLRHELRMEIARMHRDNNRNNNTGTTIYVTHDQSEGLALGDRVVVMNNGTIEQVGTPEEVYNFPKNTFVASFLGSPPMGIIHCSVEYVDGTAVVASVSHRGIDYSNHPHSEQYRLGMGMLLEVSDALPTTANATATTTTNATTNATTTATANEIATTNETANATATATATANEIANASPAQQEVFVGVRSEDITLVGLEQCTPSYGSGSMPLKGGGDVASGGNTSVVNMVATLSGLEFRGGSAVLYVDINSKQPLAITVNTASELYQRVKSIVASPINNTYTSGFCKGNMYHLTCCVDKVTLFSFPDGEAIASFVGGGSSGLVGVAEELASGGGGRNGW